MEIKSVAVVTGASQGGWDFGAYGRRRDQGHLGRGHFFEKRLAPDT